jgi:RNA polymerase sigma factor (TIGR02999 family)
MNPPQEEISQLIVEWQKGNREAENLLFDALYRKLREIAGNCLKTEPNCRTLGPTALVHEAYIRLINSKDLQISGRSHFVALIARVMRRIVIDRARTRNTERRGGDKVQLDALDLIGISDRDAAEIISLESALTELEAAHPRQARVVELKFFAGLSIKETAEVLGVAERSAKRDWQLARLRLREVIDHDAPRN